MIDHLDAMMKECFGSYFHELNKNVIAPDWETETHYGIKLLNDNLHYREHLDSGAFCLNPFPEEDPIYLSGRYCYYTNRVSLSWNMAHELTRGTISNFKFKMGRYLDKVIPQIKRKRMFGPHRYSIGKAYCSPFRDGRGFILSADNDFILTLSGDSICLDHMKRTRNDGS